jgi:hypothetical protein
VLIAAILIRFYRSAGDKPTVHLAKESLLILAEDFTF